MKWIVTLAITLGLLLLLVLLPQDAAAPEGDNADSTQSMTEAVVNETGSQGTQIEIYDGIQAGTGDRVLDLSSRGLSGSLKAEVRQLSALEVLDISDNDFTGLPAEVGQLSNLRVLNLADNPLTGLPHELGNLQNLETFDLRGTDYAAQDLDVIKNTLPASTEILVD